MNTIKITPDVNKLSIDVFPTACFTEPGSNVTFIAIISPPEGPEKVTSFRPVADLRKVSLG